MKIVQAVGWYHPDSLGGTEIYVPRWRASFADAGIRSSSPRPTRRSPRRATYEHDGCEVFRYPIPATPTREEAQGDGVVRGAEHFHRWLARRPRRRRSLPHVRHRARPSGSSRRQATPAAA